MHVSLVQNIQRPDDRDLIRNVVRTLAARGFADVIFGGIIGPRTLRITDVLGTRTRHIHDQLIPPGEGLGGQAMAARQPVVVGDYFRSESITHRYDQVVRAEGLLTMAAVPVVVAGRTRSVLYAATRSRVHFGATVLAEFAAVARAVSEEIRIRDEVDRRIALLRASAEQEQSGEISGERVHAVYAELVALAATLRDAEAGRRITGLLDELRTGLQPPSDAPRLSRREQEVLAQVALGCSYPEVARRLLLQPVTVKSYMRSIMAKLEVHSRMEAVSVARRLRLLP